MENPMHEQFLTIKEYAAILKISVSTIYRNPTRFHMFRVGNSWRANAASLEKFANESAQPHQTSSAAVLTKSGATVGRIVSNLQLERELAELLAPKRKKKA